MLQTEYEDSPGRHWTEPQIGPPCLLTLDDHGDSESWCAFSPDGSRIISGSHDHTVKVWDAADGTCLHKLPGSVFTPDAPVAFSSSSDSRGFVITMDCGIYLRGFSPDGGRVVSAAADGTIMIRDTVSGDRRLILAGHCERVNACAFSPDGTRLVSGASDKALKIWDVGQGTKLAFMYGHDAAVSCCAFSQDGGRVVSGAEDGSLKIWEVESGSEIISFGWTSLGRLLIRIRENLRPSNILTRVLDFIICEDKREALLSDLSEIRFTVNSCAFSPDGSRVVSASENGNITMWDALSGAQLFTMEGHNDGVNSVAFSPDGSKLASGSNDKTLKIWDAISGAELATLYGHGEYISCCAFSRDNSRVVSASGDGTIKIWDVAAA